MTMTKKSTAVIQAALVWMWLSVATSGLSFAHDVEPRAAGDKIEAVDSVGSSPSRIIQRHLSPHRMMHFGKRPLVRFAPTISAVIPSSQLAMAEGAALDDVSASASTFDLYGSPLRQRRSMADYAASFDSYPYLMELQFGNGQILQEIPDDVTLVSDPAGTSYNLAGSRRQQRARLPTNGQQLMKLVESVMEQQQQQQQQQNQKPNQMETTIGQPGSQEPKGNVATRSPHSNKNRAFRFPDLVGLPGALDPSLFGLFDKKAEPKDNFFMHFGRK